MAKSFDIAKHIKSHSELTFDELNHDKINGGAGPSITKDANGDPIFPRDELIHFKASIDISQFIAKGHDTQEKIDRVMKEILSGAKEEGHTQREKKRVDTLANGDKVQRYRNRRLDLDDTLSAYHSRDVNNEHTVEPHFHVLADKLKRFGVGYSGLIKMFQHQADKHGLVFHFAEESKNSASSNLQQSTSRLSWQFQENSDEKLEAFILDEADSLRARLDLLQERVRQDGNIQFYLKTVNKLQERLRRLGLSFEYQGNDIAFDYDLPLSPEQEHQLDILSNGDIKRIQPLLADRSSIIARDYIKTIHGFQSSIIESINASSLRWDIPLIPPENFDFRGMSAVRKEHFIDIDTNEDGGISIRKRGGIKKVKGIAPFLQASADDMRECARYAATEKEFKTFMEKMGYTKIGFRTKERKRIGIKYLTKGGKTRMLYFDKLGLTYDELDKTMLANRHRLNSGMSTKGDTRFDKKRAEYLADDSLESANKRTLYANDAHINENTFLVFTHARLLFKVGGSSRSGDKEHHSLLRSLGFYIDHEKGSSVIKDNKGTRIREKGDSLVIDSDTKDSISEAKSMLTIAHAKGWDINKMDIKGSNTFIAACMKLRSHVTAKGSQEVLLQNLRK